MLEREREQVAASARRLAALGLTPGTAVESLDERNLTRRRL